MGRSGWFVLVMLFGCCAGLGFYAYKLRGEVSRLESVVADLEAFKAETDRLKGQLAEIGKAKAESERRSSFTLDLQGRALALQQGLAEVRLLIDQVVAAEMKMRDSPDESAFTQLRENLAAACAKAKACKETAEGIGRAIDQAGDLSKDDQQSLVKTRQELPVAIAAIQSTIDSLDRAIASLRVTEFDVLAHEGWQPTDAKLETGEVVCIRATGTWTWGRVVGSTPVGPQGVNGDASYRAYQRFTNAALLLRIRGLDEVFPGWQWAQPPRGGTIELRINDNVLNDNQGSMKVKLWILRPALAGLPRP